MLIDRKLAFEAMRLQLTKNLDWRQESRVKIRQGSAIVASHLEAPEWGRLAVNECTRCSKYVDDPSEVECCSSLTKDHAIEGSNSHDASNQFKNMSGRTNIQDALSYSRREACVCCLWTIRTTGQGDKTGLLALADQQPSLPLNLLNDL